MRSLGPFKEAEDRPTSSLADAASQRGCEEGAGGRLAGFNVVAFKLVDIRGRGGSRKATAEAHC
ncbi:hypothetical protein [Pyrobaculum arsenaticum]|uniref:Uncharacterized protein n=1 Tax=Pyrobaculum arsenaticum TaxID=121277 RepID=A0A7L4P8Y5_9CREN|nr:hypothetical protein [Pyrobaculum arsenaticum]NYR15064.1 hypothetical protein [Pyrobaculum arsenaticum]